MKRIGIITALLPEAACLTASPPDPGLPAVINDHISLLVCGMGSGSAKSAAHDMVNSGIEMLVSWGTAGALISDLEPGDLIVPEEIIGSENQIYQTTQGWRSSILHQLNECPGNIFLGRLADSLQVLTSSSGKSVLNDHKSAQAVDMESAAIAAIAARHDIPFVVIRAISDSSSMAIPDLALKISNQYGQVQLLSLLSILFKHPLQIPQLARLASGFRAASKTLKWIGQRQKNILRYGD